ncbi:hypothetical protein FOFC_09754 [Fusarium oxysporum]|nr:hypothetical protein FOFC_09754 [Fusarium oxysporum]
MALPFRLCRWAVYRRATSLIGSTVLSKFDHCHQRRHTRLWTPHKPFGTRPSWNLLSTVP